MPESFRSIEVMFNQITPVTDVSDGVVVLADNSPPHVEQAVLVAVSAFGNAGTLVAAAERYQVTRREVAENEQATFEQARADAAAGQPEDLTRIVLSGRDARKAWEELAVQEARVVVLNEYLRDEGRKKGLAVSVKETSERLGRPLRKAAAAIGATAAIGSVLFVGAHAEIDGVTSAHKERASNERVLEVELQDDITAGACALLLGSLAGVGAYRMERKFEGHLVRQRARGIVRRGRRQERRQHVG